MGDFPHMQQHLFVLSVLYVLQYLDSQLNEAGYLFRSQPCIYSIIIFINVGYLQ